MIGLRNIKLAEVSEWVRGIVREEIKKAQKAQKKASSKAKKASIVLLALGASLAFSGVAEARIRPRNIDSRFDRAPWEFGSAIQLAPNPSAATDAWNPQTGMLFVDDEGKLWFHNGTEFKEVDLVP